MFLNEILVQTIFNISNSMRGESYHLIQNYTTAVGSLQQPDL